MINTSPLTTGKDPPMSSFHIYLDLPGTTENALKFYGTLFNAECLGKYTYADMAAMGVETPPNMQGREHLIAHAGIQLPNMLLMSTDNLEAAQPGAATNVFLHYTPESREDAERVFTALAQNGTIVLPLTDYPWGYNGRCIDRFGVAWEVMLGTDDC